jgi:arylsulfatase A-like enzyme
VIVALVAAVVFTFNPALTRAAQRQPNIVLIIADDMGYRDIGAFGQDKIRTPNIDRLATEG